MSRAVKKAPPYRVGFLLFAEFPLMAFASAIEPLRAANRLAGEPLFEWRLLRLDRARTMLLQTTKPILDVAVACGFASASHFSRCYRAAYGRKPSDERAAALAERPLLRLSIGQRIVQRGA